MKAALILLTTTVLPLLGQTPAGQTFTVAGTVVDARSDRPINRVSVILAPASVSSIPKPFVTAPDGAFSFQVPAGTYNLTADYKSVQQGFSQGKRRSVSAPVIVGTGKDTSQLVFRWFSLSAISGTVTDDRGEPVEGARVQLIGPYLAQGIKRQSNLTYALTDDRGNYRFSALPSGTFYLAVTAEPWYSQWFESSASSPPVTTPSYSPVYYPSASTFEGAASIEVGPGDERRADVQLAIAPGVTLYVNCPEARDHDATLTLLTDATDGVDLTHRQVKFSGASKSIPGILPGHYRVRIAGTANGRFNASATVDVGNADLTVNVPQQPSTSVEGKIVIQDRQSPSQGYVLLFNQVVRDGPLIQLRPDGTFRVTGLASGPYLVSLGVGPEFAIVDTKVEGAVIRQGNIDIQEGAAVRLNLTISDDTAHVKLIAMTGQTTMPGAYVVIVPREPSEDKHLYFGVQTGTDGSYEFPGVRPGDYLLFAFDDQDFEYANRSALAPHMASGVPLHVEAHQKYEKQVPVVVTQTKK